MQPVTATLLLVDDDPMNLDVLARRLVRKGYSVITASGGVEALETIETQRVDAVLLDVMMPGVDGLETLRRLRRTRSIAELPVIMVTANDQSEDVVRALDLGANDYVTKPVDFPVVLARIRTQVTSRRSDPLTGLPNRVLFVEQLDRVLTRSHETGQHDFAVLFLDVDRFKIINDSLGHLAGDELLVGVARRLQAALRSGETALGSGMLARFGGDEFTLLLEGINGLEAARDAASRILRIVAQPFELLGREVFTSVSIGLVAGAPRYRQAEDVLRDADTAMYRAKALGKARCELFDRSMLLAAEQQLQLQSELRRALERGELQLHYQPIVSLASRALCGFEALLRWHHPTRGVIGPSEFIPIAEENGLIVPIGSWVIGEACRQLRVWDAEATCDPPLTISVNLSARQCRQSDLVAIVARVLDETSLAPERLKLEITESVLLEHTDAVLERLHALRALGVQLGIDDFGMGYSALSYLQRFPFQTIKIDRSFVSGMHEAGSTEIVRSIVSLGVSLEMDVTAEGVETAEQAAGLERVACEFGQGYYFSKPLARDHATELVAARARTRAAH